MYPCEISYIDTYNLAVRPIKVHDRIVNDRTYLLFISDWDSVTEFDAFRTNGYTNMIPSNLHTNISTKNMAGSQAYDNIWASRQLQRIYSGKSSL